MDFEAAKRSFDDHLWLAIRIAQMAPVHVRGSLTFISGTGGKRPGLGLSVIGAATGLSFAFADVPTP